MGLDNFWELPEGVPHPNFDPPLNLWGGLFSDHGCKSFRGKMYSTFCDMVMGINLYDDVISNQELLTATERLRIWIEENPFCEPSHHHRNIHNLGYLEKLIWLKDPIL